MPNKTFNVLPHRSNLIRILQYLWNKNQRVKRTPLISFSVSREGHRAFLSEEPKHILGATSIVPIVPMKCQKCLKTAQVLPL